ncbi:hypothetical protein M0G74_14830 [Microbulbifer sp. CAU 1566]|uniref:hypothetical protein n=1 Tax=Microbulbifer sp. CAU 1566 TaxID=2933269 RepID=UPI00200620C5|nr:hypothetical protein [Microbulbifer sp. CAU 1566]MCK7598551.1 hypothetical protein [Microbulbifer sp. CAU 1566]
MQTPLYRLLLLLLALTLNGQAFAAPCGSINGGSSEGSDSNESGSHHQMTSAMSNHCDANAHHCHQGSGTTVDSADKTSAQSCEQACSCCPGHCASVITVTEHASQLSPLASYSAFYSNSHASPLPEAQLRPPILL